MDTEAAEMPKPAARTYFEKGNDHAGTGAYDQAIACYTEALRLQPDWAEAYFNRGSMYALKGVYDAAITEYDAALGLRPDMDVTVEYLVTEVFLHDPDVFWTIDRERLERFPNFWALMISRFRREGFTGPGFRRLVGVFRDLWESCRYDPADTVKYLYQYTSQLVLNKMMRSHRLRLNPARYQNDPNEGKVFFTCIRQSVSAPTRAPRERIPSTHIDAVAESAGHTIAFIRSLTTIKDGLVMWNSQYANDCDGVAIGVPVAALQAACSGLGAPDRTLVSAHQPAVAAASAAPALHPRPPPGRPASMPIPMMGLYKIQ